MLCEEVWLWNGVNRLAGDLSLFEDRILFRPQGFFDSSLKLEVCLSEIEEVDSILVFGVSRLGIRIQTADGADNRFVFREPRPFYKALYRQWKKYKDASCPGR